LRTLVLMLGPDFITDEIKVETCDHAVLNLRISYNNEFIVDKDDEESVKKVFSIPDFIGYTCSIIGSRIREHVAQCTFDQFHRNSNAIIEEAVFHRNEKGEINKTLLLEANNMVVSNVDVHSIEPADPSVLASLTKSVQMGKKKHKQNKPANKTRPHRILLCCSHRNLDQVDRDQREA